MRAETIVVTDHALDRWKERASKTEHVHVDEIIEAVKNSRIVKRGEPLPHSLPRLDGSVYSVAGDVLFVMEPVTIDEYRLVTVRGGREKFYKPSCPAPENARETKKKKDKVKMENSEFPDAKSERDWLVVEKLRLERELASAPKKSQRYKTSLAAWGTVEERLRKNKPKFVKEREAQPDRLDYGKLLLTILQEVRELKIAVETLSNERRPQRNWAENGLVPVQPTLSA